MAFRATFWNGSANALSGNGTQLSISDYSNYWGERTGQAQAGGAHTITLDAGASPYNNFYLNMEVNIVAGTGAGQGGICTGYVGATKVLTTSATFNPVPDTTSVFQVGQPGHLQKYFSDFRKLYINAPSEVWLLSTMGDGNATTISAAGNSLPLADTYIYKDGDEVYNVILYTLPTWSASVAYLSINNVNVYYGLKMWKLLKNDTGTTPGTDITVWQEVTDITQLFSQYIANGSVAVYCDILACKLNKLLSATDMCNPCNAELQLKSLDVQRAIQLSLAIDAIPGLAGLNYWTSSDNQNANVRDVISFCKNLCCCTPKC